MTNENIDLLIIGAGPAGLAAAVEAQRAGMSNLLVIEKGPSHSQMIRTYYKEGKRVDAQYAGVEALCTGVLCLRDGNREGYLAQMDHVIESSHIPILFDTEIWSLTRDAASESFLTKTTAGPEYHANLSLSRLAKWEGRDSPITNARILRTVPTNRRGPLRRRQQSPRDGAAAFLDLAEILRSLSF